MNHILRVFIQLQAYQFLRTVPDRNHAFHALLRLFRHIHGLHNGIFPVMHGILHYAEAVIFYIRIGGYTLPLRLIIDLDKIRLFNAALHMGKRILKLFREGKGIIRQAGTFHAVGAGNHFHPADHHFRMVCKILVHHDTVFFRQVHPVRFQIHYPVPFL